MNIEKALERMKANPSLKMTMPHHYRSYEYNYFDEKSGKFLLENGQEWDIALSRQCNEIDGWEDYK